MYSLEELFTDRPVGEFVYGGRFQMNLGRGDVDIYTWRGGKDIYALTERPAPEEERTAKLIRWHERMNSGPPMKGEGECDGGIVKLDRSEVKAALTKFAAACHERVKFLMQLPREELNTFRPAEFRKDCITVKGCSGENSIRCIPDWIPEEIIPPEKNWRTDREKGRWLGELRIKVAGDPRKWSRSGFSSELNQDNCLYSFWTIDGDREIIWGEARKDSPYFETDSKLRATCKSALIEVERLEAQPTEEHVTWVTKRVYSPEDCAGAEVVARDIDVIYATWRKVEKRGGRF